MIDLNSWPPSLNARFGGQRDALGARYRASFSADWDWESVSSSWKRPSIPCLALTSKPRDSSASLQRRGVRKKCSYAGADQITEFSPSTYARREITDCAFFSSNSFRLSLGLIFSFIVASLPLNLFLTEHVSEILRTCKEAASTGQPLISNEGKLQSNWLNYEAVDLRKQSRSQGFSVLCSSGFLFSHPLFP